MARCPCQVDPVGGYMTAGCGIQLEGSGNTFPDRRKISVVGSACFCGIVSDCLSARVCKGLSMDDGCLGVKISADAGNGLAIGTDGGLMGTCPTESVPPCGPRVDRLPTFVCGGRLGAGVNVDAASTGRTWEHAIAVGHDMTTVHAYELCDGAWYTGPTADLTDSVYQPQPQFGTVWDLLTDQASALKVRPASAYGWCKDQCGLEPLPAVLARLRTHLVPAVEAPRESVTRAGAVGRLRAVLDRECMTGRALVFIDGAASTADRNQLTAVAAAGYATAVQINNATQATAHPPADLVAAGFTWVFLHRDLDAATVAGYVAAGLQAMMLRAITSTHVAAARDQDMRGVLVDDPSACLERPCALEPDMWCFPAVPGGQIAMDAIVATGTGPGAQGRKVSGECGWVMATGPSNGANATLLPRVPDTPELYALEWEMKVTATTGRAASEVGLIVCAPDDTPPLAADRADGAHQLPTALSSGYVLRHSVGAGGTSQMRITKLTAGQPPGPTVAAPVQALVAGQWRDYQVRVTDDEVRFYVRNASNTTWTVVVMIDSEHRGRRVWEHHTNQGDTSPQTVEVSIKGVDVMAVPAPF